MSYELWCYKEYPLIPRPYILLDTNSERASSVSSTIPEAFATFGIGTVSYSVRNQARQFYDIIPVPDLDNFCNDHPELLI